MNEECAIADVLSLPKASAIAFAIGQAIPPHTILWTRRHVSRYIETGYESDSHRQYRFDEIYPLTEAAITTASICTAAAKANILMGVLVGSPCPVGAIGDGHIIVWIKAEVAKLEAWGAAHPEFLEFLEALSALVITLLI
jgi:hypothetical protein